MFTRLMKYFGFNKVEESNPLLVEIDNLRGKIKELEDIIYHKAEKLSVSVSWDHLNVFSIEREVCDDDEASRLRPTTVIGYMDSNGVVQEWFLHCDEIQHERLVEEFNAYKQKYEKENTSSKST